MGRPLRPRNGSRFVVGNSTYRYIAVLDNPTNDARLMAETLRSLGVTLVGSGPDLDLGKAGFGGSRARRRGSRPRVFV